MNMRERVRLLRQASRYYGAALPASLAIDPDSTRQAPRETVTVLPDTTRPDWARQRTPYAKRRGSSHVSGRPALFGGGFGSVVSPGHATYDYHRDESLRDTRKRKPARAPEYKPTTTRKTAKPAPRAPRETVPTVADLPAVQRYDESPGW